MTNKQKNKLVNHYKRLETLFNTHILEWTKEEYNNIIDLINDLGGLIWGEENGHHWEDMFYKGYFIDIEEDMEGIEWIE